jgi:hypothetical protein
MNDFPIPEDPPVMMTAVKGESASLSEGTTADKDIRHFLRKAGLRPGFASTEPIRRNMNSQNNHEVIVSGIHLDLTPSLKTFVREKAERLFRHEERIMRVRVELECERSPAVGMQFTANMQLRKGVMLEIDDARSDQRSIPRNTSSSPESTDVRTPKWFVLVAGAIAVAGLATLATWLATRPRPIEQPITRALLGVAPADRLMTGHVSDAMGIGRPSRTAIRSA